MPQLCKASAAVEVLKSGERHYNQQEHVISSVSTLLSTLGASSSCQGELQLLLRKSLLVAAKNLSIALSVEGITRRMLVPAVAQKNRLRGTVGLLLHPESIRLYVLCPTASARPLAHEAMSIINSVMAVPTVVVAG